MTIELFVAARSSVALIGEHAQRAEAAGFHGISVVDSQNLAGDVWVGLSIAAAHTERLKLATGVTNPVTRHPAVTAAAAASVQAQSGGRVSIGIGRGDSALAHIGRAPASVATLERYIDTLQAYLSGEALPFDNLDFHPLAAPPVAGLALAESPEASRLRCLDAELAKVPVDVTATGPRVIAAAARCADRVMFALGANAERIAWGVETARKAREEAGGDAGGLAFGAYVNLVCHPEVEVARELVSGGLATIARFAVMHGQVTGPVTQAHLDVLQKVRESYSMEHHARVGSTQSQALTPEFIDSYAIAGPPAHCIGRLRELAALGLTRFTIIGPTMGANPQELLRARQTLAAGVLPAFKD